MGNNFTLKTWLNSQLILKLHDQGVLDAYLSLETFVELWSESQALSGHDKYKYIKRLHILCFIIN